MKRRRALFAWQPQHTDVHRQERHVLAYADRMGLDITAYAVGLDEDEIVALVGGGFVDVLLVDLATEGSDHIAELVEPLGGQVHAVYRRSSVARVRTAGAVLAAVQRGASIEAIAQVLGMSISEVEITIVTGDISGEPRPERTTMLARPASPSAPDGLRPQRRTQLVDRSRRPTLVGGRP